ncbi:hypothetical protein A0H81_11038 [Grifola frondosa]|uniref:Uncharacterized protein n=1 Tax=Grifola frondosa TaxID=5627 RepID=A0A1C7LWU4_GRIFR|nr:hypothetical protein A0H81_11038 [Grifola frondosa]
MTSLSHNERTSRQARLCLPRKHITPTLLAGHMLPRARAGRALEHSTDSAFAGAAAPEGPAPKLCAARGGAASFI